MVRKLHAPGIVVCSGPVVYLFWRSKNLELPCGVIIKTLSMNIAQITPLVEASIAGLKVDPALCRGEKPGQWSYKLKDANIWIDVFNFESNPAKFYLQVMSPLCVLPDKKTEEFALDILEINYKMIGASICKRNDWLYVINIRETDNIDQSEIDATFDRVGFYSTDYYAKLAFKYEGCWTPKPPAGTRV